MCDPVSAMAVASGGTKAAGSIVQGYQSRAIARWNAAQMYADAGAEEGAGRVKAATIRKAGALQVGAAKAGMAAAGANVNAGTGALVPEVVAGNVEHDALTALLSGQANARMMRTQAEIMREQGSAAFRSGLLGGGGNLLATGAEYGQKKGWGGSGGGSSGGSSFPVNYSGGY